MRAWLLASCVTMVVPGVSPAVLGAEIDPRALPIEGAVTVGDVRVPSGQMVHVTLPALPQRAGKLVVLRLGAVAYYERPAGCNFNMTMRINGGEVGRRTATGAERLIGRAPSFRLTGRTASDFPVFSGTRIMLMFAPDQETADAMTEDGLGGTFLLDVSDLVSGVDGNTISFTNTRAADNGDGTSYVLIQGLTAGWLDRAALPPQERALPPTRGPIARTVSHEGLSLGQGSAGGFTVALADGPQLLVETTVSMDRRSLSLLRAEDGEAGGVTVRCDSWSDRGFQMMATFSAFTLTRTVHVDGALVHWAEDWVNTSGEIMGLPFRHRLFLRDEAARFTVAGDPDASALAGCSTNPTVFVESEQSAGAGLGVTAESDWLRLLMYAHGEGGLGEIYSECLALPPGGAIRFELTITPVREGGYWSFINQVRRRWGVNGITMARPLFLGYSRVQGDSLEDVARKSLGHLGPIYVSVGDWMRLSPDARVAARGEYPKLPADAPRAPGDCPDLDLDAFLRFEHRERWWAALEDRMRALRRACPEVQFVHMTHPAMEVVYQPLADRFPIAGEVIRTADGQPFHVSHYDRAHLGDAVTKGWAVYYYSPRPGSRCLQALLADCRRSLDWAGSDGIYCDEFSWAGRSRGYSRYDYSRWDGYSADLDPEGRVVRLKSDNAYTSESCQLQMAHECLVRGKFFLGNGGSALRSLSALPLHRFIEGGNGYGAMADGHLSPVPLVLGNFGDRSTREGVFAAVRECLSLGCVYSPPPVNLVLEGADNFVCKQYPLTVREIGPGWVVGEGRLITAVPGKWDWPGRQARARLYRYDATGALIRSDELMDLGADTIFTAVPPEGGLFIAELLP